MSRESAVLGRSRIAPGRPPTRSSAASGARRFIISDSPVKASINHSGTDACGIVLSFSPEMPEIVSSAREQACLQPSPILFFYTKKMSETQVSDIFRVGLFF